MTGWEHEGPCDCPSGEGHRVDRNYCEHGTFVGDPYGPDYMCHWCEDGISDADYAAIMAARERRANRVSALAPRLDEVLRQMHALPPGTLPNEDPVFGHFMRLLRWGVRSDLFWNPDSLKEF